MKTKKLAPNLMVKDVGQTVTFYTKHLGINLVMAVPETQDGMDTEIIKNKKYVWAKIKKDQVEIMLQEVVSLKNDVKAFYNYEIGASVSFYIEMQKVADFYNQIKNKVEIIKELTVSWYGMHEFYIRDNNGYILCFAEPKKN